MSLDKNKSNADVENDTNQIMVKLVPFDEQRLFESLITKQHFVLIASRDVSELADDKGHLIDSQIRNYGPERIAKTLEQIGGADVPFYTIKLTSHVIPVYRLEQILSKTVMSCMLTFDEVELEGINQQIFHIARLINVHTLEDARQFIHNMNTIGFPTKCTFELEIGTTYCGKKPTTKCFKWRVDILPSGQAVFVVGLFDSPAVDRSLHEIELSVSFEKLIDVVMGTQLNNKQVKK